MSAWPPMYERIGPLSYVLTTEAAQRVHEAYLRGYVAGVASVPKFESRAVLEAAREILGPPAE